MRINILSPGRFHVFYLAKELSDLGHDVRFYSYVPKKRAVRFGLPEKCSKSVFGWVLPNLALIRMFEKTALSNWAEQFLKWWMDLVVSLSMRPCDVVIAMSGNFYRSVTKAKKKWSAKVLIERGSRHILSQKEILDGVKRLNPKARTVPDFAVRLELRDYQIADRIVIPSKHVEQSFYDRGFKPEQLFKNPYGVDVSMFGPTPFPDEKPTVLMVGGWGYRKGCDLLVEALESTDYRLIHAGPIGDLPFPKTEKFFDFGFVDQTKLKSIYAKAHIMVLPSREEGLALVQIQALACGLPIVCSDRTGGEDLMEYLNNKEMITLVKTDDVLSLRNGIEKAMRFALAHKESRNSVLFSSDQLSWKAYGERYNYFLKTLAEAKNE